MTYCLIVESAHTSDMGCRGRWNKSSWMAVWCKDRCGAERSGSYGCSSRVLMFFMCELSMRVCNLRCFVNVFDGICVESDSIRWMRCMNSLLCDKLWLALFVYIYYSLYCTTETLLWCYICHVLALILFICVLFFLSCHEEWWHSYSHCRKNIVHWR